MKKITYFLLSAFILLAVLCAFYCFWYSSNKTDVELIIAKHLREDLEITMRDFNLLLGSSSIENLNQNEYFCGEKWLNRGIGDSVIDDVISYLDKSELYLFPDKIILYVGENDIAKGMELKSVIRSFARLIDLLESKFPHAEIHVLALKPSPKRELYLSKFETFNGIVKGGFDSIIFHETNWNSNSNSNVDEFFLNDGIHLTKLGYAKFLEGVVNCHSSKKD